MLIVTVNKHESVRVGGVTVRVVKDGSRMRWHIEHNPDEPVFVSEDGKWRLVTTPVQSAGKTGDS